MKVIRFLRPFATHRMVKGSFKLAFANGGANHGFAYGACDRLFNAGQEVTVRPIKKGTLVLANNPVMGEVVLDGAIEGEDFEVVSANEAVVEVA